MDVSHFPHLDPDLAELVGLLPDLGESLDDLDGARAMIASLAPPVESVDATGLTVRDLALDEHGKSIDSATFARQLGQWRDEGIANTIFVIGGADGLSPDLQRKAKIRIAFGSATWPHQMVRVMLLEQIYRAATILAGHPYHRA